MKTIEEAAKDVVKCTVNDYGTILNDRELNIFKAGVEFAQRWIPIEEELPPIRVPINIKFVENNINHYSITTLSSVPNVECLRLNFQYWRLIEIE